MGYGIVSQLQSLSQQFFHILFTKEKYLLFPKSKCILKAYEVIARKGANHAKEKRN